MKLSGIKAHIWQRASAFYLSLYFPYLAFWFFSQKTTDSLLLPFANTLFTASFTLLTLIAIFMLFIHAWVGIRDILIDYLPDQVVPRWLTIYAIFLVLVAIDLAWLATQLHPGL